MRSARSSTLFHLVGLTLALVACLAAPSLADDRSLLSAGSGRPYVFILLDTSGSMNWAPKCTAQQVADGICTYLCPEGDCPVPRDGDDSASKFRQAKEALSEVLGSINNIDFGFASFNQDLLGAAQKHWLYRVRQGQPVITLAGNQSWPRPGDTEVFGAPLLTWSGTTPARSTYSCNWGNADENIGCFWTAAPNANSGGNPADIDALGANDEVPYWERQRAQRIPRLGATGLATTRIYLRTQNNNNQRYRITYTPIGLVVYGSPSITVRVAAAICTNTNCSTATDRGSVDVVYDLVGDFLLWDYGLNRKSKQGGFWNGSGGAQDVTATGLCNGWDLNNDTTTDRYPNSTGYSLRFPTTVDPTATILKPYGRDDGAGMEFFDYGDRIPLDWTRTNKGLILRRLSPNGLGSGESFANATYLADIPRIIPAETYLRLKDEGERPLIPVGSTPLGFALSSFRDWYCEENQPSRNCKHGGGWLATATSQDPRWGCRQKYLLVVTDGDDTCPGRDPCSYTASLRAQTDILTYVVAYGVQHTAQNKLTCMAANGGTGDPIYPQNKQELVTALTNIFAQILERTSTFASAAVPSVQATVADKIYVTNFTPVKTTTVPNRPLGASIWSGRLLAFLKPLPLDQFGSPDTSVLCGGTVKSKCFLWDAGDRQVDPDYTPDRLLLQTPTVTEVSSGNLRLGIGVDERRILYHRPGFTGNLRLFNYPTAGTAVTASADENDLWSAMGLSTAVAQIPASRAAARAAIDFLLEEKEANLTNPLTGTVSHIHYVLGDIFHSDPAVVESPSESLLYKADLYSQSADPNRCGTAYPLPTSVPPPGYRAFVTRHACRRKMLVVGANDGQLHLFDTGIWTKTTCDVADTTIGFDNGTGRELLSFIPREVLPTVRRYSTGTRQDWSVDGRVRISDVFVDPLQPASPRCDHREWRTLLLGSLREGGRSYFALDITQPDILSGSVPNVPVPAAGGWVPSCTSLGAGGTLNTPSGCGPLPFPALRWEFTDSWDEDDEGEGEWAADLAETWSQPTIGRIRVCKLGAPNCTDAENVEDRWVAVFGGGVPDEYNGASEPSGDWLYMVDMESGMTLYKRPLEGSAPAPAAAVDIDQNGYLDTIYIGTTAGFLYKVDLGPPTSPLPIVGVNVSDYAHVNPSTGLPPRIIPDVPRIVDSRTRPYKIFSTGGKPIYMETTVIYVALLQRYALAFGTGNRRSLWEDDGTEGRFYLVLDTGFADPDRDGCLGTCGAADAFYTEADYFQDGACIDPEATFDPTTPDYLFDVLDPTPGWCLALRPNEKLISDPFAITGITSFTSYVPDTLVNNDGTCASTGYSRIFVVKTTNANPYVFPDPNNPNLRDRYSIVGDFTTQPFAEQSTTKNPPAAGDPRDTADKLCTTPAMAVMREELKRLFPEGCRFTNWTVDVKTIRSDTGIVCVAPIPQCVLPRNWKEY